MLQHAFSLQRIEEQASVPYLHAVTVTISWKMLKCGNRSTETEVRKSEEKPPISV